MYRLVMSYLSFCLAGTAPTNRVIASRLGKIPTMLFLLLISQLSRTNGFFDQIFYHTPCGNTANARISYLAPSTILATSG
jgi:hypothetical protein